MLVYLDPLVSLLASPSFPPSSVKSAFAQFLGPCHVSNVNESKSESEVSASMDNYQKIEKIGEGTCC